MSWACLVAAKRRKEITAPRKDTHTAIDINENHWQTVGQSSITACACERKGNRDNNFKFVSRYIFEEKDHDWWIWCALLDLDSRKSTLLCRVFPSVDRRRGRFVAVAAMLFSRDKSCVLHQFWCTTADVYAAMLIRACMHVLRILMRDFYTYVCCMCPLFIDDRSRSSSVWDCLANLVAGRGPWVLFLLSPIPHPIHYIINSITPTLSLNTACMHVACRSILTHIHISARIYLYKNNTNM